MEHSYNYPTTGSNATTGSEGEVVELSFDYNPG
jgi:hypothetical protein